ncbi:phosphate uptake regulator PhoU [Methanonatronarchaeum sp. AMET6-2]|uniref:phosphate signaling complex PhoU family protein n=1 Tax=Methanonatronarchaeum sp. AMET6-2 TaxID=2933293 RepID=UPI00121E0006|nr:phosphate uptake regulator PhoU [Methanonatronarchaeum sp. AMET6-2]RZN63354.1 MAG: phosphate uptake regulator PhoU [Methanonatronarchaeia archaeon]UOY10586.1 phosphate uptake regulator PhoU [Methanonatronarchaeum sp. AMET6-2]
MESRKIYKSGGSTYVMSLPKKWIREFEIEEGDSVLLSKSETSINVYTEDGGSASKNIKINTKQIPNPDGLLRTVIAAYLMGAETIVIELKEDKKVMFKKKLEKAINNLIGIELVEDVGDQITLEIFIDYKRMGATKVLNRIHNIMDSMLQDLEKGIEYNDREMIEDALMREAEVDRLYFLVVRELNYATTFQAIHEEIEIKSPRDVLSYYAIVKSFERASDHIEDICRVYLEIMDDIDQPKISKDTVELAKMLRKLLKKAWEARKDSQLEEYEEVFGEIKEFQKKHREIHTKLFTDLENPSLVRKYTDIMISLSRIAQYISDMTENEVNINVKNFSITKTE